MDIFPKFSAIAAGYSIKLQEIKTAYRLASGLPTTLAVTAVYYRYYTAAT
jgi:hypothetical protein